jgi:hypothetical protein
MPQFERYIGIDYSGAETPTSSLPGLAVFEATAGRSPVRVAPPPGAKKHWTRRGLAEWLVDRLREPAPSLVGIDHAFSFPLRYFEKHGLLPAWDAFLDDFQAHWPTDSDHTYVDFVRDGLRGDGASRSGNPRWRRLTELRARTAKSVFHFDVPGSVAKSTHAGLPWLRYIRRTLAGQAHFWPFDAFDVPVGRSVVVEVYPSLWRWRFRYDGSVHEQDAYAVSAWLQAADADGTLSGLFHPALSGNEQETARVEGWILGVR